MVRSAPGVLLLAHGTRHPRGLAEVEQLAWLIRRQLAPWPVKLGFLELAKPQAPSAAAQLLAQGADPLVIVPLLLFAAGHWRRDVPQLVRGLERRWPGGRLRLAGPLECQAELVELAAERFKEAAWGGEREASWTPGPPGLFPAAEPALGARGTGLLLVGRGSSDPQAQQQLHRLAHLVQQRCAAEAAQGCFMHGGKPLLADALREVERLGCSRVVVQPHLLFQGRVLEQVHRLVHQAAGRHPGVELLLARHLGPDPLLARLLAAQARAAI